MAVGRESSGKFFFGTRPGLVAESFAVSPLQQQRTANSPDKAAKSPLAAGRRHVSVVQVERVHRNDFNYQTVVLRVHRNNCNCQTVVRRVHRKKFLLRLFRSFLGCSAPAFSPILGGEER